MAQLIAMATRLSQRRGVSSVTGFAQPARGAREFKGS
jgi:hypothetical protein